MEEVQTQVSPTVQTDTTTQTPQPKSFVIGPPPEVDYVQPTDSEGALITQTAPPKQSLTTSCCVCSKSFKHCEVILVVNLQGEDKGVHQKCAGFTPKDTQIKDVSVVLNPNRKVSTANQMLINNNIKRIAKYMKMAEELAKHQ